MLVPHPIPVGHARPKAVLSDLGYMLAYTGGMLLLLAVLFAGVLAAGCTSTTPTPDPNNGVSDASYRDAIKQSETDFAQLEAALGDLKAKDAARGTAAMFPPSWWDSEILLAKRGERLCAATLQGSNPGPSPSATPTLAPSSAPTATPIK